MKKTVSMRVLAFLAVILTGAVIGLQIFAVMRPDVYGSIFFQSEEVLSAELPKLTRSLFMMRGVAILPLTILFLVNGFAGRVSRPRAVITVILMAIFSILRTVGDHYFYSKGIIEASRAGDRATALAGAINSMEGVIGWLGFLAIMLMCCAAGAEFHAAGHSKADE